jgi:hypothetical protein
MPVPSISAPLTSKQIPMKNQMDKAPPDFIRVLPTKR